MLSFGRCAVIQIFSVRKGIPESSYGLLCKPGLQGIKIILLFSVTGFYHNGTAIQFGFV